MTLLVSQEHPGNNIIPQGAGIPLTRSHRLVPIQFHQVLLNLLFTDKGDDFTSLVLSCSLRESRKTENLKGKNSLSISAFSISAVTSSPYLSGVYCPWPFFPTKVLIESLFVILHTPFQVLFHICLGFPIPSLHI